MRLTKEARKSLLRTLPAVLIDNGFYIENPGYFCIDTNQGIRYSVSQNLQRMTGQHNLKLTERQIRWWEHEPSIPQTVVIHFR
ncbi:MAG: hypothetical protein P8J32_07155 [bacterium]|nr:hypothetical protein [bacterium]